MPIELTVDNLAAGSSMLPGLTVETLALIGFVGTVLFCGVQALVAPRRTFCSQKMH
jgi:hypothetical protein